MYLRLNTQFNPFTYDELVKPLADYGKAYKEAEDVYTTLSSQTEAFKDMVNQNINSEAYNMYKGYSDDLNKALDDFSKGMTSSNRSKLLELKKRYAGEIIPIAKASEALKEANALRDKAGPDAIFEVGRYKSLDDFLHGKVANNKYTTMSQIATRAKEKAQAVGATVYNNLIKQGVAPQTALTIMQDPNNPDFKAIYDSELQAVGADNYDSSGQSKISNAINAGISSALGKIAEGEIMTAAQRDASARAWASYNEDVRQQGIALKLRGYDKDGNIDYDSPYWQTQGLKYDKEKREWQVIGKPGTTKSTSKSGDSTGGSTRVNRLTKSIVLGEDGTVDEEDITLDKSYKRVDINSLPEELKKQAEDVVKDDKDGYDFYLKGSGLWTTKYNKVAIVPRDVEIVNNNSVSAEEVMEIIKQAQSSSNK